MEKEIEKANTGWFILVWIYIVAAVYSVLYDNFFLKEIIMSTAGIMLIMNYLVRKRKYKDELKADERIKRISGMSSNLAFIIAVITIAILAIMLDDDPALIDAKGVLVLLLAVIIFSKVAGQLYYMKIKKEIGF